MAVKSTPSQSRKDISDGADTRSGSTKAGGRSAASGTSAGRDNASATTLELPETWRMSVVYSATKERWRGDRSVELAMAPQSGLWSVKIVKTRPSSAGRKCLIERYKANSSRSNALYFFSAGDNLREKKAKGD